MKQIITQKNFVEKLKRRNEKALEYVIREYGGYVKAAVNHNLAGLPEEMEECMDDVFLDVWEHIERFDAAKGSFRNWIISIARFRSIDYLRRYSRTCMEEDVSNYESKLARNDRIDTLEQEISTETEKLLEGLKEGFQSKEESAKKSWKIGGTRMMEIYEILNHVHSEEEYIEEDYPNGLKVITNAETKLTFEIEKAITTGDMVDVIWTVTYPDYDAETYDVDFRMRGGDLYYGDQKLEETSSLILGEESDLKENQRMYDNIYLIPDGMELEEGDVLTMKFDGLNGETTHIDKSDPKYADRDEADLEALYSDAVLIEEADWTLEFVLQESKFEPGTLDCSNSAKIVEATLSERMLKFTSIGDFSLHEYIKIKMKDGTYLDGKDFQAGGSEDYDKERQQIDFVIEFSMPIDISQVELVVIGNERLPIKE